jgi:hypothetical protein
MPSQNAARSRFAGNNIRAQARRASVANAFDPRLRAGIHPAAVL